MQSSQTTESAVAALLVRGNHQRLVSLDVFRGVTIVFMILVNTPGGQIPYAQLRHAEWNGWTATDLVFPSFLFIVGVSLVLSTASRLGRGESKSRLVRHALRRATILFALGLIVNSFPHFVLHTWRIPGVLQRIALCYLVAQLLYLYAGKSTRWVLMAALLIGYWIAMRWVPVPGVGVPGLNIPLLHPDNNLAAWLDRKLMMGHLYEGVRDPEGVLSTFPAIVNALAGVTVGEWLHELRCKPQAFLRRSVLAGIACFVAGELWGIVFPINKKLWTTSYVLLTVGIAMLALALCYWLFDVRHWKAVWIRPAIVFGRNAIVAYFFSEIVASALWTYRLTWQGADRTFQNAIYVSLFRWIQPPQFASLVYSLTYIALCYAVVCWLDRRGIYLRV